MQTVIIIITSTCYFVECWGNDFDLLILTLLLDFWTLLSS